MNKILYFDFPIPIWLSFYFHKLNFTGDFLAKNCGFEICCLQNTLDSSKNGPKTVKVKTKNIEPTFWRGRNGWKAVKMPVVFSGFFKKAKFKKYSIKTIPPSLLFKISIDENNWPKYSIPWNSLMATLDGAISLDKLTTPRKWIRSTLNRHMWIVFNRGAFYAANAISENLPFPEDIWLNLGENYHFINWVTIPALIFFLNTWNTLDTVVTAKARAVRIVEHGLYQKITT